MTQYKTIREWFEQCDEPWAKEAINLTSERNKLMKVDRLSRALRLAFVWELSGAEHDTPESIYDRWDTIHKSLLDKNQ